MIEVKVGGLIPEKKNGSYILLLKVPGSPKYLPVWIGPQEANAIAMAIRGQPVERPLTHDLLKTVIDGLGAVVSRVVITGIQNNTFFARIFLTREHEIVSIDARPSDSVALAVRAKCPIYLTEELLASQADNLFEHREEEDADPDEVARASAVDALIRSMEGDIPDDEDEFDDEEDDDDDEEDDDDDDDGFPGA